MFHNLKGKIGPKVICQQLPSDLNEEGELKVKPEAVLAHRYNQQGELELLIKWRDLLTFENSWELFTKIKLLFLTFHLEDKVPLMGEEMLGKSLCEKERKES